MRFIIREQEYERLLAAGRLKYRSGSLESWRLTAAIDGYQVMRIDLDRRDVDAANSVLFHLLLDPDGRIERLKLRDVSPEGSPNADILVNGDRLSISRNCDGHKVHDELDLPSGFGLLMPNTIGLALFTRAVRDQHRASAIRLDGERCFEPSTTFVEISPQDEETVAVTGQTLAVRPYLIRREEMKYTLWLDQYGLPVRLDDQDGRLAFEERYVRHHWRQATT